MAGNNIPFELVRGLNTCNLFAAIEGNLQRKFCGIIYRLSISKELNFELFY